MSSLHSLLQIALAGCPLSALRSFRSRQADRGDSRIHWLPAAPSDFATVTQGALGALRQVLEMRPWSALGQHRFSAFPASERTGPSPPADQPQQRRQGACEVEIDPAPVVVRSDSANSASHALVPPALSHPADPSTVPTGAYACHPHRSAGFVDTPGRALAPPGVDGRKRSLCRQLTTAVISLQPARWRGHRAASPATWLDREILDAPPWYSLDWFMSLAYGYDVIYVCLGLTSATSGPNARARRDA